MSASGKFGVRLFRAGPARPLADFIPVFHGWIQRQALAGHQLIDVHDYSHVAGGPGILLVAHEANVSLNSSALVYTRKQPAALRDTVAAARQVAQLLAGAPGGQIAPGRFEVFVNDRLATVTAAEIATMTGGTVVPKPGDPRERPTFVVT